MQALRKVKELAARGRYLLLVAWTCACVAQAADDSRPVILAIGESTTAGFGVPAGQSYPAQLQALLDAGGYDYRVVNHGRSGSTTAMALANLDRGVALFPDIVLVALGGNDRGNPAMAARTEDNLRKIVAMFVGIGAQVYLADRTTATDGGAIADGSQDGNGNQDDASANPAPSLYATIANEEGATLMPSLRADIAGRAEFLLSDMSHPNAAGYAIVARRIFNLLEPSLRAEPATP